MDNNEKILHRMIKKAMTSGEGREIPVMTLEKLQELSKAKDVDSELFAYAEDLACEMNKE